MVIADDVRFDAAFLRADVVKVLVDGELDVYTAPTFRDFLRGQLHEGVRLHLFLDLRGVGYFDSTALGVTVLLLKELGAQGGRLVVRGNENIEEILGITGMVKLIPLVGSDEAALEKIDSLSGGAGS